MEHLTEVYNSSIISQGPEVVLELGELFTLQSFGALAQ